MNVTLLIESPGALNVVVDLKLEDSTHQGGVLTHFLINHTKHARFHLCIEEIKVVYDLLC